MFYRLGVRSLGLTWNQRNLLASGVDDGDSGGGLTALGGEAVKVAQNLGILLDVSHLSARSFWDLIEDVYKRQGKNRGGSWRLFLFLVQKAL